LQTCFRPTVSDAAIAAAISRELGRQQSQIELIASENIVSADVLAAQGSVLTNKYAEATRAGVTMGAANAQANQAVFLALDRGFAMSSAPYAALTFVPVLFSLLRGGTSMALHPGAQPCPSHPIKAYSIFSKRLRLGARSGPSGFSRAFSPARPRPRSRRFSAASCGRTRLSMGGSCRSASMHRFAGSGTTIASRPVCRSLPGALSSGYACPRSM
jgi:hypothetical protein